MKPRQCLSALLLLPLVAAAVTLDIPRLPPPAFVDREAAGDAAIPAGARDNLRRFRLEHAFTATPSNNVHFALASNGKLGQTNRGLPTYGDANGTQRTKGGVFAIGDRAQRRGRHGSG